RVPAQRTAPQARQGRRADLSRSSGNSAQLGDGLQAGPALRTLTCALPPITAHRRNGAQRTQPGLMVLYFKSRDNHIGPVACISAAPSQASAGITAIRTLPPGEEPRSRHTGP